MQTNAKFCINVEKKLCHLWNLAIFSVNSEKIVSIAYCESPTGCKIHSTQLEAL